MKLGRKAVKTDSRTLKVSRYMDEVPPAPALRDWTRGMTQFGSMLNNVLGCCTIAAAAHAVQIWSLNSVGLELTISDSDVLAAYESWDGYDPSDPSTDQGGIELDVLNRWRRDSLAGHALLAFADPDISNLEEIRQSINIFGGVYIGMNVPRFIMQSPLNPATVWDVVDDDGGIVGGHAVFVCGYDAESFSFISWGNVYRMSVAYWNTYVDEAHCLLSSLWINSSTGSPGGFNLAQLNADLSAIT